MQPAPRSSRVAAKVVQTIVFLWSANPAATAPVAENGVCHGRNPQTRRNCSPALGLLAESNPLSGAPVFGHQRLRTAPDDNSWSASINRIH